MKVLITGASGLVGRALQDRLKESHDYIVYTASSSECNLENYEETLNYFRQVLPTYVIHLAAHVGGLYKNLEYKVDMLEKNVRMNTNVLQVCHKVGVKKVISCLSTCIFPDKTTYPINETMLHEGPPHFSNDAYAYSKRLLEVHSRAYQEQYNKDFICVIPTNIYGPHDCFSLENGHVIPSLIHQCYQAKKFKKKFIVKGTGRPLRQFIYSKDLAQLLQWVLEKYKDRDPIILSVPEKDEVSIDTVAKLIAQEFEYTSFLEYDSTFSDGQFKKTADNRKLAEVFPDFEYTTIEKGIHETVEWFCVNYETCRKC